MPTKDNNMPDPKIAARINAHIPNEQLAAHSYTRLALTANAAGMFGCEAWFRAQAAEELSHRDKLLDWLNDYDQPNDVPAAATQTAEAFGSDPATWFTTELRLEESVTRNLSAIAAEAQRAGDYVSLNLLLDLLREQDQSERQVRDILARLGRTTDWLEFDEWVGELVEDEA